MTSIELELETENFEYEQYEWRGRNRSRIRRSRGDGVRRPADGGQRRAGARSVSRRPDQESRARARQRGAFAVGQAIGGMLKGVARQALPLAGTALGTFRRRPARRADRQRPRVRGGQRTRPGSRSLEPGGPRVRRREAVRAPRRRRRQERARRRDPAPTRERRRRPQSPRQRRRWRRDCCSRQPRRHAERTAALVGRRAQRPLDAPRQQDRAVRRVSGHGHRFPRKIDAGCTRRARCWRGSRSSSRSRCRSRCCRRPRFSRPRSRDRPLPARRPPRAQAPAAGISAWLQPTGKRRATAAEAQRRFTILRLKFNIVLTQFDMFADVITQRSENETGVWLSGLDVVAADALALPGYYDSPPVICYLDRDVGAAIRRARTRMPGGGENPVAIIRVPRERMVGHRHRVVAGARGRASGGGPARSRQFAAAGAARAAARRRPPSRSPGSSGNAGSRRSSPISGRSPASASPRRSG